MNRFIFEYEEKHHILCVDGIDYEIPQRTPVLEEKLKEHDKKLGDMTEYEGNMELLSILFGEENAKQMFPDKESTNLDKLAKCTQFAISLFMSEINKIKSEKVTQMIGELKPMLDAAEKIGSAAQKKVKKGKK